MYVCTYTYTLVPMRVQAKQLTTHFRKGAAAVSFVIFSGFPLLEHNETKTWPSTTSKVGAFKPGIKVIWSIF